jgi:hypothetical protein
MTHNSRDLLLQLMRSKIHGKHAACRCRAYHPLFPLPTIHTAPAPATLQLLFLSLSKLLLLVTISLLTQPPPFSPPA